METSARRAGKRCDIVVDEAVGAPARYRYMYTPLEERAASLEKGLLSLQVRLLHVGKNEGKQGKRFVSYLLCGAFQSPVGIESKLCLLEGVKVMSECTCSLKRHDYK